MHYDSHLREDQIFEAGFKLKSGDPLDPGNKIMTGA